MAATTEQRIERIMGGGFSRVEAEALVAAEDARNTTSAQTKVAAPKLTKVHTGHYVACGGRFAIVALQGWYRGTWVLFDKEDRSRREYGSKREAQVALAGLVAA